MDTQAFRGADVLVPKLNDLETVRLFGSEAQLVGFLLEQKDCLLMSDADIREQGVINWLVNEASTNIVTSNRSAILSSRVA